MPSEAKSPTTSKNERQLTSKMMNRDIIRRRDNLSEITVEFSEETETPGLLALFSTELAMNGVFIQEVYSADVAGPTSFNGKQQEKQDVIAEISFIVSQKDALKAYQVLQELSER